ncbi:MAG: hypothetical protein IKR60_03040 [Alphaproteobacteria bacterium]|nr:hypothetical protein [Alphaproteobacteria bacterium]
MKQRKVQEKLQKINFCFYDLITNLKETQFDLCAYLVEEAYRFYMTELERRLKEN